MSNNKNNRKQDKVLIDTMHPNQLNPGLAKPEEFRVKTHAEAAKLDVPLTASAEIAGLNMSGWKEKALRMARAS